LGFGQDSVEMRNKELNNGRMAMMSVLGIFVAEAVTGKDAVQQFGLFAVSGSMAKKQSAGCLAGTSSAAITRAPNAQRQFFFGEEAPAAPFAPAKPAFVLSEQVGCMEPLGYFDPLGFCPDEEAEFKKLRANEVKHGRLAMMASVGLLGQSFLGAGHGSISSLQTVEGPLGITFILMVSAFVEATWPEDPEKPGDFGDPLGFGQDSVEMRNKELNNGRMAMMSVVGIFVAEAVTGKDAVQQFGLF